MKYIGPIGEKGSKCSRAVFVSDIMGLAGADGFGEVLKHMVILVGKTHGFPKPS